MKRLRLAVLAFALVALLLPAPLAWSQEQGQKPPPRPPEIEKLLQLAKNPDKLRQALTDPRQVQELMDLMESDAVREFARDPQRIMELMTEINPGQIRDAIQSIDPSIMRRAATARWMERLRTQLGATDEEWKVLGPRVEALLRAQQAARAGIQGFRAGGFGGPPTGGPGGGRGFFGPGPEESSEVEEAAAAVREATQDPSVPDRDASLALAEYRKARNKARGHLSAAEHDLRELLTQRQEAILVTIGLLE